jgi:cysteine desulfurase
VERFYFDHNATTPVSEDVFDAMRPVFLETYGNASSIHYYGQLAKQKLEQGRRQAAALVGCDPTEIVFTGGGTEADNLALLGFVRHHAASRKHVITTAIEHPAVLNACAQLEREGVAVTYTRVGGDGVVEPDEIRRALRPETVLISVMHANNELGSLQPVADIARIAREAGVAVHSDGVQAAGKIPVNVRDIGVDFYTMSGHKIYAPKGIGVLYARKGTRLGPILYGGHHERDRRPGTENVPSAVGFGCAAARAVAEVEHEGIRLASLRDRLERGILERVPGVRVNAAHAPRVANTSSVSFDGIEGEAMVIALDLKGFAASSGAACSSGAVEPSHVLLAIGLSREQARGSLRFSFGRSNTAAQVDALVEAVVQSAAHLRKISPVAVHA